MEEFSNDIQYSKKRSFRVVNTILAMAVVGIVGYYFFSAPLDGKSVVVHVASKQSVRSIATDLESKNVIREAFVLRAFMKFFASDTQISRGDYLFMERAPVWNIAWQLARGKHNIEPIKITFPEGTTTMQMANTLASSLSSFRKDLFLTDERSAQGYLFPDTYFFFAQDTTDEIVDEMSSNFKKRTALIQKQAEGMNKKFSDIITMASVVEQEANGKDDAPVIAGILWKRISIGMPLQVDIAPETYKILGLPKGPINNPGLSSIQASSNPKDSQYLYYLHDRTGTVHYAKTYAEHRANIARYLK